MPTRRFVFLMLCISFMACKEHPNDVRPKNLATSKQANEVPAPIPMYQDLNGNEISLDRYQGKRIFVNYWATWCKPCVEEMPALEQLQQALEDEAYIFLYASDQSIETIRQFKQQHRLKGTFVKFNGSYMNKEISALPVSLVYTTHGEQVLRFDGQQNWNSKEMMLQLKNIH